MSCKICSGHQATTSMSWDTKHKKAPTVVIVVIVKYSAQMYCWNLSCHNKGAVHKAYSEDCCDPLSEAWQFDLRPWSTITGYGSPSKFKCSKSAKFNFSLVSLCINGSGWSRTHETLFCCRIQVEPSARTPMGRERCTNAFQDDNSQHAEWQKRQLMNSKDCEAR
eukprot:3484411-Amphidinium_carterae.1